MRKLFLDESVDHRIAGVIELYDIDVITPHSANMKTAKDPDVFQFIQRKDYVLLTQDDDFLSLAENTENHPGIIYVPQNIGFVELKARLKNFLSQHSLDELQNQIWYPKPSEM